MLHLRETLTMPNSYYRDITDSAPAAIKESMNARITELNSSKGKSKMLESLRVNQVLKVLREAQVDDLIVQKVINKLKEGGVDVNKHRIYRLPVARINPPGTLNGNHRRYTAKLWENVMNNQEDSWKGLCGLADHPTDDSDPGSFKNRELTFCGNFFLMSNSGRLDEVSAFLVFIKDAFFFDSLFELAQCELNVVIFDLYRNHCVNHLFFRKNYF